MIYRWKDQITGFTRLILDIFFPRTCVGCGKHKTSLCSNCLSGATSPNLNLPTWIHSYYSYKNTIIRSSIWQLKYKNNHDIARVYGKILYEMILEDISESILFENREIYLIPIPLSNKRLRERGYNQTDLLVKEIIACDTEHAFKNGSNFLKRLNTDNRQSHVKNKRERQKNIIDSFETIGELPKHAHFILIDDVVTTGATLREAKKTLIESGARKISAYTIAH